MNPCVKRFCGPYRAVEDPHTPQISKNFKTFPNINDVEMSEQPPPKKARVARGKSDGKYL
jgi:hypothetical protein